MRETSLKPLGFGEILDGGFTLYRRHFTTIFLTALLPMVPVILTWIGVMAATSGVSMADAQGLYDATSLLLMPYSMLAQMLVWGALVYLIAAAYTSEGEVRIGAGYRVAIRKVLPLLGASIVGGILTLLGLILLVIPGILVMIALFALGPAVVLEDAGPVEAVKRSYGLTKGAFLRIGGVWTVAALIVFLPSMALGFVAGFAAAFAPGGFWGSTGTVAGFQLGSVVISALTTPYMVACFVLLYFDRRVRTEGYDLERAVSGLEAGTGPTAEALGA